MLIGREPNRYFFFVLFKLTPLKLHEIVPEEPEEPLKTYTEEELVEHNYNNILYKMSVLEEFFRNVKKPNLSVIKEYSRKHEKYLERVFLLEEITNKRNEMSQLHNDLKKKRYNEFMYGYHIISKKVKEMYRTITFGGDAELELCDSMDPFHEGISFGVRPPKKSWKVISNLSGGEKTLASLALVFALHYYKPSPLYVMDEIDAALDFKNVSIVANYIKERAKNAQFVIISLRSNMFEMCDTLSGIYKVHDCSCSISVKNVIPVFSNPNKTINENNKSLEPEAPQESQEKSPVQPLSVHVSIVSPPRTPPPAESSNIEIPDSQPLSSQESVESTPQASQENSADEEMAVDDEIVNSSVNQSQDVSAMDWAN